VNRECIVQCVVPTDIVENCLKIEVSETSHEYVVCARHRGPCTRRNTDAWRGFGSGGCVRRNLSLREAHTHGSLYMACVFWFLQQSFRVILSRQKTRVIRLTSWNSGVGKTWCGEPASPSSHHHHRVVYIGKKGVWIGEGDVDLSLNLERGQREVILEREVIFYCFLSTFILFIWLNWTIGPLDYVWIGGMRWMEWNENVNNKIPLFGFAKS
jgi:hypothetical protein